MVRSVRIFLSSPGDVAEERAAAARIVRFLDLEFGERVVLETVRWEGEPLTAGSDFQSQIVRPSETDIVVLVLWARLGTPLPPNFVRPDGTGYLSGTEWEFEEALAAFEADGKPQILAYRKTKDVLVSLADRSRLEEQARQKDRLDAFCHRHFGDPRGGFVRAFHSFETLDQFEELLRTHIRKRVRRLLEQRLDGVAPPALPLWPKGSPFRGLEAFDFEHAPIFFGRTPVVTALRDRLVVRAAEGTALVLVHGASGCGKSSIVRAGLAPTLVGGGSVPGIDVWRSAITTPATGGGASLDALTAALVAPTGLPALGGERERTELAELLVGEVPAALRNTLSAALRATVGVGQDGTERRARLLLVVDQFEEIFDPRVRDADRQAFANALVRLARTGVVWVVLTARSEYYGRCMSLPRFDGALGESGPFAVGPPDAAALGRMIREPAAAAGLSFDVRDDGTSLDAELREAAAAQPDSLSLLEFTLERLFAERRGTVLTFAAYDRLGGLSGAIARRATDVVAALPVEVGRARNGVLGALAGVGDEGRTFVARRVDPTTFAPGSTAAGFVDAFVDGRLFVRGEGSDGAPYVRVAHESLLVHWESVSNWLQSRRGRLEIRDRVARKAQEWERNGRLPADLLSAGRPLDEAEALTDDRELVLDAKPDLAAFIAESKGRRDDDLRRSRRLRRIVTWVAGGAAAVVFVLAVVAVVFWQIAESALADATVMAAAHEAIAAAEDAPHIALERALDAWDAGAPPTPIAQEAVTKAVSGARHLQAVLRGGGGAAVTSLAFSADGESLHVGDESGHVLSWDLRTGTQVAAREVEGNVVALASCTSGPRFATVTRSGHVLVWAGPLAKAAAEVGVGPARGDVEGVWPTAVAFDALCERLFVGFADGQLAVHAPGDERWSLCAPAGLRGRHATAMAAGPDGQLAVRTAEGAVFLLPDLSTDATARCVAPPEKRRVWGGVGFDARTGALRFMNAEGTARGIPGDAESADGVSCTAADWMGAPLRAALAAGGARAWGDGEAVQWSADTGTPPRRLGFHPGVAAVAIAPGGARVATGGRDGSVYLWDPAQRLPGLSVIDVPEASVTALAFSADGKRLLLGVDFGRRGGVAVLAYSVAPPFGAPSEEWRNRLESNAGAVRTVAVSDSDRVALVCDHSREVRAVGMNDGRPLDHPCGATFAEQREVVALAAAPQSAAVVAGTRDGALVMCPEGLWRACRVVPGVARDGRQIRSIAFSPTAPDVFAVAGADGRLTLRTLAEPLEIRREFLRPSHAGAPRAGLGFLADGRTLLLATDEPAVEVWDVDSGTPRAPLLDGRGVVAIAASPTHDFPGALVDGDGRVLLWTTTPETRVLAHVLTVLSGDDASLAYHPTGPWVAVAGGGGQVWLVHTELQSWVARARSILGGARMRSTSR